MPAGTGWCRSAHSRRAGAEFYSDEESELLANPQLPSASDLKHAAANVHNVAMMFKHPHEIDHGCAQITASRKILNQAMLELEALTPVEASSQLEAVRNALR